MVQPVRTLLRSPGFSALAVAIVALGLGAALAVVEVADAVLLRPLPFADPDRVVTAWQVSGGTRITLDGADFLDWRAQAGFEQMAAVSGRGFTATFGEQPERIEGAIVSEGFFPLLGAQPLLGRALSVDGAAVLSESLWRSRFAGDRSVIGRTLTLDGEPHEIAGVMPARFRYPPLAEVWVAARTRVPDHPTYPIDPEHDRARHYLTALARLKAGTSLAQAEAALKAVQARLVQDHPPEEKDIGAQIVPMRDHLFGPVRPLLLGLLGVAAVLLGVAWANAAHLFLARAVARAHESAVRVALGASRGALWRMFFAEAFVLCAVAGVLAIAVATLAAPALVRMSPQGATLPAPELSARVLAAAIALVAACGASLGLTAALQPLKAAEVLQEGGRTSAGSRHQARLRSAFLVFEVALSLVLLAGSGLLLRSFRKIASVDPGFEPAGVLAADVPLARARHPDKSAQLRFAQESLARLRADPLVDAAGYVSRLPFSPNNTVGDLALPGRENEAFPCDLRLASDGYFETLRIPLREGRTFSEGDLRGEGPPAVILNEAAANKAFGGRSALGQQVLVWGEAMPSVVVGVVGDIHHLGLEAQPRPEAFRPLGVVGWPNLMLVMRGKVPAPQLAAPLRAAIHGMDRDQPLAHVEPMQQRIGDSLSLRAFTLTLLSVMAGVAALLAIAGIYGVTSYLVAQRTREFGVRMALGATPARVLAEITRETMLRVGVGCLIGLATAGALARALQGFLFGVPPIDAVSFAGAASLLAAVATAAAALAGLRGARVDPAEALRA
ncbi:MAG TPA: ABC transporter permease [Myxococcales bacterium]|nr:ABC transporter permease [Myxococcales bacterium]